MRNRILFFSIVIIMVLLFGNSLLYAWSGEPPFGLISRETILRRATEMLDFSWSPLNQITNYGYICIPGVPYTGEAYYYGGSQNWAEFYGSVNSTSGGTTSYGNDCSAFVSISWQLPTRYGTTNFENDAIGDGGYVTKLGAVGSGQNVGLLPGDAFVASGSHIILFESYSPSGINAIEQTPPKARRRVWTWSDLASYRPIRRNNIDEGNYEFVTKWGSQGDQNGQFNYPAGIAVDSSSNVYVTEEYARVQKFDSNGGFITKWGSGGTGNGQFAFGGSSLTAGIAVDGQGYVYVADAGNYRVQKFNSNGGFITKWGAPCDYYCQNGQFIYPDAVAADSSGYIYVLDSFSGSYPAAIQKFTNTGGFITKWGPSGTGNGQFDCPTGIAVDSFGNVFVADTYNHRIQKFTSAGSFITKWGSCCLCDACPGTYFHYPTGVAVDASGNVYVADSLNYRIQKFDSNGTFITKWGSWGLGNENGKFQYPIGVAVDLSLNVYVADTFNHNIQKFRPVSPYPSKPTSLTASAVSPNQINLSWVDNSNNETGFTIVRKKGLRGNYSAFASTLAGITIFSDTPSSGLSGPDTYYYAVYATNYAGYSAYSNEASATIVQAPPAAPTNLTINAVTSNQIVISWTDNSTSETGFKIERKIGVGGIFSQIALVGTNVTSYADSGLTENTSYYYRVTASNAGGDSSYSNEANATTQQCQSPVRIESIYYATLQAAYNAASDGAVIQSRALTFIENLSINRNISVSLQGGYDCAFGTNSGNVSNLKGMIQTFGGGGALTISNFNLIQQ